MHAPARFTAQGNSPKTHAQRNLEGRTHYVDDDTLRYHKSRILSARIVDDGLLFAIVTSDALDMNNSKRGYRYVIFDIFGTVLDRPELEHSFKTSAQATKGLWAKLNTIDAKAHTLTAIGNQRLRCIEELDRLAATIIPPAKE